MSEYLRKQVRLYPDEEQLKLLYPNFDIMNHCLTVCFTNLLTLTVQGLKRQTIVIQLYQLD